MKRILVALPLALLCGACNSASVRGQDAPSDADAAPIVLASANTTAPSSPGIEIEDGIWREEVHLREKSDAPRLWIYRPRAALSPKLNQKFPCVFIAPAGTTVTSGQALEDDARDTHLPYVRAGMIVVAYELGGLSSDRVEAAREFQRASMGLVNARHAISYALRRVKGVDPNRLYAVGHSSAGTVALQLAQHDRRIRACVAFAPACNFAFSEAGGGVFENAANVEAQIPGFTAYLGAMMPQNNVARLKCPLFLFGAEDDHVVSFEEVQGFARAAQGAGVHLTFEHVPNGGHVDAMKSQGIDAAIKWLQALPNPPHAKHIQIAQADEEELEP